MSNPDVPVELIRRAAPCIAAKDPTQCAFGCGCTSSATPSCDCSDYCHRHADAIVAHRENADHELHDLALSAHHPNDVR